MWNTKTNLHIVLYTHSLCLKFKHICFNTSLYNLKLIFRCYIWLMILYSRQLPLDCDIKCCKFPIPCSPDSRVQLSSFGLRRGPVSSFMRFLQNHAVFMMKWFHVLTVFLRLQWKFKNPIIFGLPSAFVA